MRVGYSAGRQGPYMNLMGTGWFLYQDFWKETSENIKLKSSDNSTNNIKEEYKTEDESLRNGAIYDLQGRKVVQSAGLKAGIYIINGKKVVIK